MMDMDDDIRDAMGTVIDAYIKLVVDEEKAAMIKRLAEDEGVEIEKACRAAGWTVEEYREIVAAIEAL